MYISTLSNVLAVNRVPPTPPAKLVNDADIAELPSPCTMQDVKLEVLPLNAIDKELKSVAPVSLALTLTTKSV